MRNDPNGIATILRGRLIMLLNTQQTGSINHSATQSRR